MLLSKAHSDDLPALLTTPGGAAGSEEDNGITKDVNVPLQALLLLSGELVVLEGERDRLVLVKRDRELLGVKVFELERHVGRWEDDEEGINNDVDDKWPGRFAP